MQPVQKVFAAKQMAVIRAKRYSFSAYFIVLFLLFTALSPLAAIKMVVIIPAWCIAMSKLLGDLLPVLRKLLQCRQV